MSLYARFFKPASDLVGTDLADFTVRNGAATFEAVLAALNALSYKRHYVAVVAPTPGTIGAASWDGLDADADRDDIDIVLLVPIDLMTATHGHIFVRGNAFTDYIRLDIIKATGLSLAKSVASVVTGAIATSAVTFTAGKTFAIRLRVNGTTVQARAWDHTTLGMAGEPTTWNINTTVTGVTAAGWNGVGAYHASTPDVVFPFAFLAAATNGDVAVCPTSEAEFDAAMDDPTIIKDVIGEFSALGFEASGSPAYTKTVNAYVSHRGFTSAAQDDPPSTHYRNIMTRVPSISIEMPGALGGEVRVNIGEMAIANPAEVRKGTPYLLLDGTSGCYASTPDAAVNSITGDIDIRVDVAATDWTPSTAYNFVAKRQSAGQASYRFGINTSGNPFFECSVDGTAFIGGTATAATGFTDGARRWLRVTRASVLGTIIFYTSVDGVTWTQLGTTVAGTAGAIFNSTSVVEIGAVLGGTSERAIGNIYRAQIYNGIAGTLAVDFRLDKVAKGATSLSTPTGEVWTINGSAKIRQHDNSTPGVRDDWLRMKFNKNYIRFWLVVKGQPKHNARELLVGCLGQPTANGDELVFRIADLSAVFQNDVQTATFSGGDYDGERMPILFGQIGRDNVGSGRIEPPLTDAANLIYTISETAIGAWYTSSSSYMRVYDRGNELRTAALTCSAVAGNVITFSADHGMTINYLWRSPAGGALPSPLANNTDYWVQSVPANNQITLSATRGGAVITLTTTTLVANTSRGYGYTVTTTAPASIQLAAGDPQQMRITVAHILSAGDLYAGEIYQDIAARIGLSANNIDSTTSAISDSIGYWIDTQKRDAGSVLAEVARGSLTYYGFSADGLFYSGRYVMPDLYPMPAPAQTFGVHNILENSMRHVGTRKAVDFSAGSEVRYHPWFLINGTYQSAEAASSLGYMRQSPASYGTYSGIGADNYPNVGEADRTFSVTQYGTLSTTIYRDFYLRPSDEFEFATLLSAFRRRPGDEVQITWPRYGFKQWGATDPASPENADSQNGRAAIIEKIGIRALDAPPITIQVFKARIGYYPTGNLT